jgi:hypothetical protein
MKSSAAMVACSVLGSAVMFFAATTMAAQRDFPVGTEAVLADNYPDRKVAFPKGVTGYPDVVYSVLPGFRPLCSGG